MTASRAIPSELMRAGRRTAAGTWRSALLLFTACRRSDVVELGRQHILDGWIIFEQSKTGGRVEVPILPPLTKVLPADRVTFLVTERGASFSVEGFGNWFRAQCDAAGVAKSAHGLRKAAGGLLAEMGRTGNAMMAVLRHADEQTSSSYTRSASRRILAESTMRKMQAFKWRTETPPTAGMLGKFAYFLQ